MTRTFLTSSRVEADRGFGLALAPALTPEGITASPSFFHGFAVHPAAVAQGLLVLADVTAMRYFQYTPSHLRDPVLTAHGDRLRAECFSACNGVYARLDLLGSGLDGGEIGFGTTNVDINSAMRSALARIRRTELMHLDIGDDGLVVSTLDRTASERPVRMPDRWVRALGNVARLHRPTTAAFTLDRRQTRAFLGTLPHATSSSKRGWLVPDRTGARLSSRRADGGVYIDGLHRLSALKRLLVHATGLTAYALGDSEAPAVVEVELPGARLALGLTEQAWRGFSGEGSLLESLAAPSVLDDADLVSALLAFEPVLDVGRLSRDAALTTDRVTDALAVLAASGRVGWDAHDESWFHRELPHDPSRIDKDNPRLVGARKLVDAAAVEPLGDAHVVTSTSGIQYRVRLGPGDTVHDSRCTCPWYLRHGTGRGPCKHVLAVYLSALQLALDVYHDLGWDRLPLSDLPSADIGTPAQRKTAVAGLRKGSWGTDIGSVNPRRLVLFAIRAGVDVRRMMDILWDAPDAELVALVLAARGPGVVEQFVAAACVSSRRAGTHSPTAFGNIAVIAADVADIPVPANIEYLRDWAVFAAASLNDDHREIWYHVDVPGELVFTRRFAEHAAAAAHAGVALTGPFRGVLTAGIERRLLDRDTAVDLANDGLDTAQRPADKAAWLDVLLTDLALPDAEFVDRADQLVAVLAAGVSPVTPASPRS